MKPLERRLSSLEAAAGMTTTDNAPRPWVRLFWRHGEDRPDVPDDCNVLLWRIVAPGDPPEWKRQAGGLA